MHSLDQILTLTAAVEQHVERGEWTEAGTLDAERRRLLAELCDDPGPAADPAACREVLQQLLLRNHQTIQRLQVERQRLQATAALSDQAMRAYDRNSTGSTIIPLRTGEGHRP